MQRAFAVAASLRKTQRTRFKHISAAFAAASGYNGLFGPCQRVVKSRFVAISGIWMNDSALGGLIDRGDNGANLIAGRCCCGVHLLLHRTQTRHNAAIAKRSLDGLPSAFGS